MKIKKAIIYIVLSICRLFQVFTKINPEKITFISLESKKLTGDFKMISRALEDDEQHEYKLNYIMVKFEKNLWGNIKYFFACIRMLFAINTSHLVILDYNNYVVSKFKRRGVKVLQLWHASGAIKKFGNESNRDYKINHYSYVICNTKYFVEPYARAFNVNPKRVKVTGVPRTDQLFSKRAINKNRKKMYELFPETKGKKIVLYAPTFRGRLMSGFRDGDINLDEIQNQLGNEYVVLYKMHPLVENKIVSNSEHVICCNGISIRRVFSIVDYLISDYSAIIIDFSTFLKPMLFYVPDLDNYRKEVGLYVDYENEMPGPICTKETDVIAAIKNEAFDYEKIKEFRDKMFRYHDGKSLNRVLKLIDKIMGETV